MQKRELRVGDVVKVSCSLPNCGCDFKKGLWIGWLDGFCEDSTVNVRLPEFGESLVRFYLRDVEVVAHGEL